jgi:hypothetical protein
LQYQPITKWPFLIVEISKSAILILKPIAGFARPSGVQNPQWMAAIHLHDENCSPSAANSTKMLLHRISLAQRQCEAPYATKHQLLAEGVWGAPLAPQWGAGGKPPERASTQQPELH